MARLKASELDYKKSQGRELFAKGFLPISQTL